MARPDPTFQTKNYEEQGGAGWVVGGDLEVVDGGQLIVDDSATVIMTLPTADPHVVGQLWSNAGVVTVSAG